jgi:predicted TIM-barrel fold metal-dependent hydrolase
MYDGPIIDTDVHHRWHAEADLIAHLTSEWRALVDRSENAILLETAASLFPQMSGSNKRMDSFPPTGGPPGSHYETLRDQWLDAYPIEIAVLNFDIGTSAGIANPDLASALCRAANDWSLARWIDGTRDPRLVSALLAPTAVPQDAVREIARVGAHPGIVEVLLVSNALGKPFGHPVYHPIFDAAQEYDLPIAIHNGGDNWANLTHGNAGGIPNTRYEFHTLAPQSTIVHLASFVTNGVFERFPKLKLLILEAGIAWLPWLMWSLDRHWDSLRRENPLVKRLPSEYIREHVCVSTQPIEMTDDKNQLIEALQAADGIDDVLVFSSDYPHWDTDDPSYVARRLPSEWGPKLFHENARRVLRLPERVAAVGG